MVQESILDVLDDQSVPHAKDDYGLLTEAIRLKIAAEQALPGPATTSTAGLLQFAAFPDIGFPPVSDLALLTKSVADNVTAHGGNHGSVIWPHHAGGPEFWEWRWGTYADVDDGDLLIIPVPSTPRVFNPGWGLWLWGYDDTGGSEADVRGIIISDDPLTFEVDIASAENGLRVAYWAIGTEDFPP